FQQKFVSNIEDVMVNEIRKVDDAFMLRLSNGELVRSDRVILATGLDHMEHRPEQLGRLPTESWSHSADHSDLAKFKGKDVVVIGGGQSGLETAAILQDEGASVTLVVRAPKIAWNRTPSNDRRRLYERLRRPRTRLGEGLQLWLYDRAPQVFHTLPREI